MKENILNTIESYLVVLAKMVLAIYQPVIIGITGSVGKTTTRDMIAHVLRSNNLPVLKTEGNLNYDLGIALTILGYDHSPAIWEWPLALIVVTISWLLSVLHLRPLPKYFIVEMGIDRLGDMKKMTGWLKPKVAIVTWIGEGHHLEYLKSPEHIAKEKGLILTVVPTDGLSIIPKQDPNVAILRKLAKGRVEEVRSIGLDSITEIAEYVGEFCGLSKEKVKEAAISFQMPKGRLQELKGINGSVIIDDSYNASLPSVKNSLAYLSRKKAKRKIAVLGDVLEQGQYESEVHKTILALAKKSADKVITVGKRFKKLQADQVYDSPTEAAQQLKNEIKAGDIILVKGSQGMRMEKISAALAADKGEAKEKLPRQNARWQQIPFANP